MAELAAVVIACGELASSSSSSASAAHPPYALPATAPALLAATRVQDQGGAGATRFEVPASLDGQPILSKTAADYNAADRLQVFRAAWDSEGVFFYQAYSSTIAEQALQRQVFEGCAGFKPLRMTWIKPSFAWMLYRLCSISEFCVFKITRIDPRLRKYV